MDGAVEAGERAAREVFFSLGKIHEDQIRQEEPEFKVRLAKAYMHFVNVLFTGMPRCAV
jgi:hypothetical protein